jgi:hypothetical protein
MPGEQDERAFVIGVVEGPFQSGEDPGEHVAEPVEHADPVGDQIGAVRGQQSQISCQLCGDSDGGEVPPQPGGVCDHVGVAGVGLGFTAVGPGHPIDRPAGNIDGLLAVDGK